MTDYTLNYRFALPNYNIVGWGDQINGNFTNIDAVLAQFTTTLNLQGLWTNGNMYAAGVSVIDGTTGHIWYNAIAHTSALAPTTFAADRATNPTYWSDITNPAIPAATSASNASSSATAAAASAASAATSAASAASAVALSTFRNRIANGSMEINQRGLSSYSIPANGSLYTLDRWIVVSGGPAFNAMPGSLTGYGARKQLRIPAVMNPGNSVSFIQRIEAANAYDLVGKQVTVQLNTAYTITAGTTSFSASLYAANAADNFVSASTLIQTINFTPTNTPNTYTIVFNALPAMAANGIQIIITATQAAAAGNLDWSTTNVSLEAGAVANVFERVPFNVELSRCQRYYQTQTVTFIGYQAASANAGQTASFATTMRAVPFAVVSPFVTTNCTTVSYTAYTSNIAVYAPATATGVIQFSVNITLSAEL